MFGTKNLTLRAVLSSRALHVLFLILAAITVITASTLLSINTVTVTEDGKQILTVKTVSRSVGAFLDAQNIVLEEHDEVYPPRSAELKNNLQITVSRAYPLNIIIAGELLTVRTTDKTVGKILEKNNISLGEMDLVSPSLDSVVNQNTEIVITKVSLETVAETAEIPFETVSVENSNMERGQTKVVTQGANGVKELLYTVTYHNGEEVSRELSGEEVITQPVNRVVQYGTKMKTVSRGGTVSRPSGDLSYSKVLTCTATAYDHESLGGNGITASGRKLQRGIVAVDPRVIPLGTRLYIESLDSSADYGYAVAADTGGAIKGNKVDLAMGSRSESLNFGRRSVRVYVLN